MSIALSWRDRAALVARAVVGSLPTDRNTVGGRLLAGVITPGGNPPVRGTRDTLDSYKTTPWLRAVVNRISLDTAAVDWQLYAKRVGPAGRRTAVRDAQVVELQRAKGAQRKALLKAALEAQELEPVPLHPLLDLLGHFNPVMVGTAGLQVTQVHLETVGEAFWLIEPDRRGMPVALWPVPPTWILGTPTPTRPFYRVSFRGWQGAIPATEFISFSDPDPSNPYGRGAGVAQSLADEIETDEYAAKHVKGVFFNRARPDLVVSPESDTGEGMDESEVRRLEEGWTRQSGGFWRAFKPFFMRRAVKITTLDQNLRAQQFVQIREHERNTILQVHGVSPEILGIVAGGANRATITMAEYLYGKRTLVPRLERQRAVMQVGLVPRFDERLVLDYVSPVGKDAELELEAMKAAPWAPTLDEWRARMGLDALAAGAGEVHMIPAALERGTFDAIDALDLPLNRPDDGTELPALPELELAR